MNQFIQIGTPEWNELVKAERDAAFAAALYKAEQFYERKIKGEYVSQEIAMSMLGCKKGKLRLLVVEHNIKHFISGTPMYYLQDIKDLQEKLARKQRFSVKRAC